MKRIKIGIALLCSLIPLVSIVAQQNVEEKLAEISAVLTDSSITDLVRSQQNYRASAVLFDVDNVRALSYAKEAVVFALKDKQPKAMLFTHRHLGKLYAATGKLDSAEVYIRASREIALDMRDTAALLDIDNVLGFLYMRQEKYEQSEHLLTSVYQRADSLGFEGTKNSARGNLSLLYGAIGEPKKKIELLLDILSGDELSTKTRAGTYYAVAQEYLRINDYVKTKKYAFKSIAIAEPAEMIELLGYDYLLLGETYLRESRPDSSRYYLRRATETENALISSNGWLELGNLAIKESDLTQARTFYDKAKQNSAGLTDMVIKESLSMLGLRLAMGENDDRETLRIYEEELKPYGNKELLKTSGIELRKNIFLAKARLGIPIEEAELQEFLTRSDSIYSAANTEKIAEVTEKYENEKLAVEIENNKATNFRQRVWIGFILTLLGLSLALLYFVNRNRKERAKQNRLLELKNEEISRQKEEINTLYRAQSHDTINQFAEMIRDLQFQQDKLTDKGADPTVLISIEQQLLNYKAAQEMVKKYHSNQVDLCDYLAEFTDAVASAHHNSGTRMKTTLNSPPLKVNVNFAAKLGSIISELLTNSVKYAARPHGQLPVELTVEQVSPSEIRLTYADAGPANEKQTTAAYSSRSGVGLIKGLTRHAKGKVESYANGSYDYRARFKLPSLGVSGAGEKA